jgi:hypothetical protein
MERGIGKSSGNQERMMKGKERVELEKGKNGEWKRQEQRREKVRAKKGKDRNGDW